MAKKLKKKVAKSVSKPKPFNVEAKRKAIVNSKMPKAQKMEALKSLEVVEKKPKEGTIPFSVYVKIRKISPERHKAMQVFPKAVGVRMATLSVWDEIFKKF